MDQIMELKGIWRSIKVETDAKKCNMNMTNRLPLLSQNKNYKECSIEWKYIIGSKEAAVDENGRKIKSSVCLCGMSIADEYYFINDVTKEKCVMGGVCCKRLNKAAHDAYIESLKKKGYCWLCGTKHKDLDTHFNSKNHKAKLQEHVSVFKNSLSLLVNSKATMIRNDERERKEAEYKLKNFNKCIGCNSLISKSEPEWKVRCLSCYKNYMKNQKILSKCS